MNSTNQTQDSSNGQQKRPISDLVTQSTVESTSKPKTMRHMYDNSKAHSNTHWEAGNYLQHTGVHPPPQSPLPPPQVPPTSWSIYSSYNATQCWQQYGENWAQMAQQYQYYAQNQQVLDLYTAAYWAAYGAAYAQYAAMWSAQGLQQPYSYGQIAIPQSNQTTSQLPPSSPSIPSLPVPAPPIPPLSLSSQSSNTNEGRVGARDARMSTAFRMKSDTKKDGTTQARSKALNRQIIKTEGCPVKMFKIVLENWKDMDEVNVSTCLYYLGKAEHSLEMRQWIKQHPVFQQLIYSAEMYADKFSARNISNIIWAIGKIEILSVPSLLTSLCAHSEKKLEQFIPQNVANVLWALGKMGFIPPQHGDNTPNLLDLMAIKAKLILRQFSPQNISNTILAFVKLNYLTDDVRVLLEAIGKECVALVPYFNPQALSNTAWGLSKLGVWLKDLMNAINEQTIVKFQWFVPQNIGNIMWAWANLGKHPGELFLVALAQQMPRVAADMTGQNLCNVLWGCAKLEYRNESLFKLIQQNGVRIIMKEDCPPQTPANLIWSFATLGHNPGNLLVEVIVNHLKMNLQKYSPLQLTNALWGLASLNIKDENLLRMVADDVSVRLGNNPSAVTFQAQNIANILWSFATLEYQHPDMQTAMAKIIQERLSEFNQQEIVNCVWAMAKLGSYTEALMDAIGDECQEMMCEFTCQHVAMTIYAYGKLTHFHKGVMETISSYAIQVIQQLSMQHICNVLYAFAIFNYQAVECINALVTEVLRRDAEGVQFSGQQCSNLLWSLALLGKLSLNEWRIIATHLAKEDKKNLLGSSYMQIYLAYLVLRLTESDDVFKIDGDILEIGLQQFSENSQQIHVSKLHQTVSKMLHDLGIAHRNDCTIEDGLFSVDITIEDTVDNQKVMVEVDGPSHFTANTNEYLGTKLIKDKLLQHRGWVILSVPFFYWQQLDSNERKSFLTDLLRVYICNDNNS